MKVRAKRKVDVYQKQAYQVPANRKGQLFHDFEIEVEKVIGEEIDGNNVWYQDKNGDFYWSGSMDDISNIIDEIAEGTDEKTGHINSLIDYRQLLKVNESPDNKDGEGINVAILDCGIFIDHPDFDKNKISFPGLYHSFNDIADKYGHGTHLTGLISAKSNDNIGIVGIAPNSSIEHFQVLDENGTTKFDMLKSSLQYILDNHNNFDIINMSFNITNDEYNRIEEILNSIMGRGIIMVAAAGNNSYLFNRIYYPACSDSIFSVGAINNEFLNDFKQNGFYRNVDYFFLNEKALSSYIKPLFYKEMSGCSIYAAVTSGIISKILSEDQVNKPDRFTFIKQKLDQISHSYNNIDSLVKYKLYKTS